MLLAVETGGTKILAALIDGGGARLAEGRWSTTTPAQALDDITGFIAAHAPDGKVAGIGIASFGPLDVDRASPDYGVMPATPKPHWTGSNLRRDLATALSAPALIDTDVNVAAMAEQAAGVGKGTRSLAYVTVGTGIGCGLALDGRAFSGPRHAELGHIPVARVAGDTRTSVCPFHADCLEGLTAGPALGAALGPDRALADDPALMAAVTHYLGALAATIVLGWSPDRIVWGGGVTTTTPGMIEAIDAAMRAQLGDYVRAWPAARPGFNVPAALSDAGLTGAAQLARAAASG